MLGRVLVLTAACASALSFGLPTTANAARPMRAPHAARTSSLTMMPKFLKELFPNLEGPKFGAAEPEPIDVKPPAAVINLAGKAMPLLKPVFSVEADLQALVLNLGSYDEEEVRVEIEETANSAPCVIYTYGLSPFSTEALSVLESTGCKFETVQLGLEWFALGPKGSATRVEMRKMYGQGSLPHVFIGGEWVGGLTTGADGGLAGLVESEQLVPKLRKAKAL